MAIQRRLTDKEYHAIHDYISAVEYLKKAGISLPLGLSVEMIRHGTSNGCPYVDDEITDRDSQGRPFVMVRDEINHPWSGPKRFAAKVGTDPCLYYVFTNENCLSPWRHARYATQEEINSAKLKTLAD